MARDPEAQALRAADKWLAKGLDVLQEESSAVTRYKRRLGWGPDEHLRPQRSVGRQAPVYQFCHVLHVAPAA